MDFVRWIAEKDKAGVTGGDTWPATDPVAGAGTKNDVPASCVSCSHNYEQTRHGTVNRENLKLKPLTNTDCYTCMYVYSPVTITGATSSVGVPVAIY